MYLVGVCNFESPICIQATMTPVEDSTFAEFVGSHRFAVIHFWAIWNGYDKKVGDFLRSEVPAELSCVAIGTIDTDVPQHFELCRSHGIRNLPFLAFYRDGVFVDSYIGWETSGIVAGMRKLVDCGATTQP